MAEAYARLFEAAHEGVYIGEIAADGPGRTVAANPHLKLMFGCAVDVSPADLRPFEPERFVDQQSREAFIARLSRDGSVADYLLRLRKVDGAPMWVEVTAHVADPVGPDASHDGGLLRVEALMRDVSERKRLESQARELYHQLLQAEKMAALGQTISGVAHELNNPLATILTSAERLGASPWTTTSGARSRRHSNGVGAGRADRPQPADVRAQAAHHARNGRSQPGRPRDARAALATNSA